MFKNDESPLSLFSFQDIITCLTGIMLFFLLVMSIQIIEITMRYEQDSPHRQELEELKRRNDLLHRQLASMERDTRSYRQSLRESQKTDRASLTMEKFRLERVLREKKLQQRELENSQKRAEERNAQEKKRKAQIEKLLRELDAILSQLGKLAQNNTELGRQIDEVRRKIKDRRHKLQIMIHANTNKRPIIVECTRNHVVLHDIRGDNSKTIIGRENLSSGEFVLKISQNILQKYPVDSCYLAVLAKPDSVEYLSDLHIQLLKLPYEFGLEPILESERCD